jgi:hypothetical protein
MSKALKIVLGSQMNLQILFPHIFAKFKKMEVKIYCKHFNHIHVDSLDNIPKLTNLLLTMCFQNSKVSKISHSQPLIEFKCNLIF